MQYVKISDRNYKKFEQCANTLGISTDDLFRIIFNGDFAFSFSTQTNVFRAYLPVQTKN